MEAISAYSFGSLAWLGLQSAPLLLWPSFISGMLSPEYTATNAAEIYYARQLGLAQLCVGLLTVVLSGALPLTSAADGPEGSISPYADAVVLVSTLVSHHHPPITTPPRPFTATCASAPAARRASRWAWWGARPWPPLGSGASCSPATRGGGASAPAPTRGRAASPSGTRRRTRGKAARAGGGPSCYHSLGGGDRTGDKILVQLSTHTAALC
ncbi:hypothetical protein RB596_006944 [Gaeumannomyces avenae]